MDISQRHAQAPAGTNGGGLQVIAWSPCESLFALLSVHCRALDAQWTQPTLFAFNDELTLGASSIATSAADYYTRRNPERQSRRLVTQVQALGHTVTLEKAAV